MSNLAVIKQSTHVAEFNPVVSEMLNLLPKEKHQETLVNVLDSIAALGDIPNTVVKPVQFKDARKLYVGDKSNPSWGADIDTLNQDYYILAIGALESGVVYPEDSIGASNNNRPTHALFPQNFNNRLQRINTPEVWINGNMPTNIHEIEVSSKRVEVDYTPPRSLISESTMLTLLLVPKFNSAATEVRLLNLKMTTAQRLTEGVMDHLRSIFGGAYNQPVHLNKSTALDSMLTLFNIPTTAEVQALDPTPVQPSTQNKIPLVKLAWTMNPGRAGDAKAKPTHLAFPYLEETELDMQEKAYLFPWFVYATGYKANLLKLVERELEQALSYSQKEENPPATSEGTAASVTVNLIPTALPPTPVVPVTVDPPAATAPAAVAPPVPVAVAPPVPVAVAPPAPAAVAPPAPAAVAPPAPAAVAPPAPAAVAPPVPVAVAPPAPAAVAPPAPAAVAPPAPAAVESGDVFTSLEETATAVAAITDNF